MRILIICFTLLLTQLSWADTFPSMSLEAPNGSSQSTHSEQPPYKILVLGKFGQKNRKANEAWVRPLMKEYAKSDQVKVWMVADLSKRPSFASKDMVRKKMKSKVDSRMYNNMLLDWDGAVRKSMSLDSQHHVYLIDKNGEILHHAIGTYKDDKLAALVSAVPK